MVYELEPLDALPELRDHVTGIYPNAACCADSTVTLPVSRFSYRRWSPPRPICRPRQERRHFCLRPDSMPLPLPWSRNRKTIQDAYALERVCHVFYPALKAYQPRSLSQFSFFFNSALEVVYFFKYIKQVCCRKNAWDFSNSFFYPISSEKGSGFRAGSAGRRNVGKG
jgi:hypothetical protein